jgi:hypothetical protein
MPWPNSVPHGFAFVIRVHDLVCRKLAMQMTDGLLCLKITLLEFPTQTCAVQQSQLAKFTLRP